ncbi:suppressor of cytokine signaling 5 isoform X1 [Lithobates pipiens]
MDIHKFVRRLNIKRYMLGNPIQENNRSSPVFQHSGLANASLFNPPGTLAPSIKVFRDLVLKDLDGMIIKKCKLRGDLQKGLDSLCNNKSLVIRPADKGGGIAILDRCDYLKELHRITDDRETYSLLSRDPVTKYKKELTGIVDEGFHRGILTDKEKSFLVPMAPRTPVIYYLPKLHKSTTCPPGRPIVSGIDSVTSRVGRYIDFFLQPLVKKIPSYVRDTKQILNMLNTYKPTPGLWLVTADITSLYTIIPHELGLEAARVYLERDSGLTQIQIDFILALLDFAAKHNYFWFDNQFYRQDKGVAMGAKYAPSLANLFMAKWEEDVIDSPRRPEIVLWARYIDDVLLLWNGDEHELHAFMEGLNNNTRGIKFSYEASQEGVNFLDLNIKVNSESFVTSTFFKSTDRNSYIPMGSCHLDSWLRSVPLGQYLRIRRNCSDTNKFDEQAKLLSQRFAEKGYAADLLTEAYTKARERDRSALLADREREVDANQSLLPFVTTFSMQHQKVKQLIRRHWHILTSDQTLGTILPEVPRVIFKGVSSLGNMIAPSVQNPPVKDRCFFQNLKGFYRCRNCQVCSYNKNKNSKILEFVSTSTQRRYTVEPFITCSSEAVVYLIQFPCGLQYVGRTKRALKVRLNEHIANIKWGFDKHPLSRHYDEKHGRDPSNTLYMGIDKYKPHWRGGALVREISRLEMSWIHRLKTYTPYGMNTDTDVNAFINNA